MINLIFLCFDICNYICLDTSDHFSVLPSKIFFIFSSTLVLTSSIGVVFILSICEAMDFLWYAEYSIECTRSFITSLQIRHNGRDGVSNHQRLECLFNRLFRCSSKKTSKLRVTVRCEGNSPATGEFPAQMASNAENVSIWWRHDDFHN